jgi:hypothetical protein
VSDEKMLANMVEGDIIDAAVEPKQEEVKTDAELASEAWDKVADTIPGAPPFMALDPAEQQTFIEYGAENWTTDDVLSELVKLNTKLKSQSSQFMEFDDLDSRIGGMDLVREQFADAGIPDAVDLVTDWELIDDASPKA